jgi:hypothetical protein
VGALGGQLVCAGFITSLKSTLEQLMLAGSLVYACRYRKEEFSKTVREALML